MTFQGLLASVGTEAVWQVVGTGFALIAALGAAVQVAQRRPVAPWVLVFGPVLAALVIWLVGRITLFGWSSDPASVRIVVTTFAVGALIGPLTFGPVAVTSLGSSAFAGARWPASLAAVGAVVAGFGVAGLVVYGGFGSGYPIYPAVRGLVYVVVGLFVALAVSGGHDEAGIAASAVFPLVVAVGEASERGLTNLLIVLQSQNVPPEKWAAAVTRMVGIVAPQWTASLLALGLATLFAGSLVLVRRRWENLATVGVVVVVAWVVLLGANLGATKLSAMPVIEASASE